MAGWSFRMKQLPKAEYGLMKKFIEKYQLDDPSELFVVTMRLMYEVMHYQDGQGETWIRQVVDGYRGLKNEAREYEV